MQLCSIVNETIATLAFSDLLKVVNNFEITGFIGKCMDKLLMRKELRRCRINGYLKLGSKLPDGNYSGVMHELQTKRVDIFLKGEPEFVDEPWLLRTPALAMEKTRICHLIREQRGLSFFDLMHNFRVAASLLCVVLSAVMVALLIGVCIRRLAYRIRFGASKKAGFFSGFFANRRLQLKKFSALAVFALFVHQFLWLTQLFLTNNIKTNKVVVDTGQLVKNEHDIFRADRVACFIDQEQEMNMIESAKFPHKNLLSKIFYEKTYFGKNMIAEQQLLQSDRCLLKRDPSLLKLMKSERVYLVASQPLTSFLLAFMSMFEKGGSVWLSEQIVQEYNLVLYHTARHSHNRQRYRTIAIRYLEAGLVENALQCATFNAELFSRDSTKLFKSITEFLDANSKFSNLVLGNFRTLFAGYFAILLLTFIAFYLHRFVLLLKKNQIYLRQALFWLRIAKFIRLGRKRRTAS